MSHVKNNVPWELEFDCREADTGIVDAEDFCQAIERCFPAREDGLTIRYESGVFRHGGICSGYVSCVKK